MSTIQFFIYKFFRKVYSSLFQKTNNFSENCISDVHQASEMIYNLLNGNKPCMIARFGSTELACIINYLNVKENNHSFIKYIKGETGDWWWNPNIMKQMQNWSGFFPATPTELSRFSETMLQDMQQVDILGSWIKDERFVEKYIQRAQKVHLRLLEPFWSNPAWSRVLKGKKILVVHPFAKSIEEQYTNYRTKLFTTPDILPEFELSTIEAVQSLGGEDNGFSNWFEALHWMEEEIDKKDYDICLIGCGAYGFPLAAHVKRQGKKAIHLGGALQLLFGIRGKRWENPNYGVKEWGIPYGSYSSLMNEFWTRPGEVGKPKNAENVEGACYW